MSQNPPPRFRRLTSRVFPLPYSDVDTDQIIPARFLKVTDKAGLGAALFADRPEFGLDRPDARGAGILLAGDNFGCGSSREHAAWALFGRGFRAVISTSFADIFRANALKNGIVPVGVDRTLHARLFELRAADPGLELTVDLEARTLSLPDGTRAEFAVDPFARRCLLEGIDELGYLLSFAKEIDRYEQERSRAHRGL